MLARGMVDDAITRGASAPVEGRTGLSRGDRLAVAAIFLLALALRLLHLEQIHANDPFFAAPSVDPALYHRWALAIVEGDWLGDEVFILGPLYPYFLALIYGVFGPSFLVAKLVQCLIGSFTCLLVWVLGRRLFDRRVALLAGVTAALYSMLIFYEGLLLITNLQTPLTLLLVLGVVRAIERPSPGRWLLVGVLIGISALARQNALLFAPIAGGWLLFALRHRLGLARRLVLAGALASGVALAILPATARNYAVAGDLVLLNAAGGFAFYAGNNLDATGTLRFPRLFSRTLIDDPIQQRQSVTAYAEREMGRSLKPSEVSSFWYGQGLDFIREHPAAWLRLLVRKLVIFFNDYEVWNNRSYTMSTAFSWVLRLPLIRFGWIAPLALVGMALALPDWRRLFPLYAMVGVYLVTALIFFVLSRYRMPVVPLLILFSASGAVGLYDAARARRLRPLILALPSLAVLAFAVHLTVLPDSLSMAHYNLANRYRELEKWDLAIQHYWESLERNPSYLSAYNNLALAYELSGVHPREAILSWEQVRKLARQRNLQHYVDRASRHLRALRGEEGQAAEDSAERGQGIGSK
jgi:4-amino-4-deoxy-L-arabinose transferase-like glycosyltransferase